MLAHLGLPLGVIDIFILELEKMYRKLRKTYTTRKVGKANYYGSTLDNCWSFYLNIRDRRWSSTELFDSLSLKSLIEGYDSTRIASWTRHR